MAQYSSYPYIVNKDRPKAEALQRLFPRGSKAWRGTGHHHHHVGNT